MKTHGESPIYMPQRARAHTHTHTHTHHHTHTHTYTHTHTHTHTHTKAYSTLLYSTHTPHTTHHTHTPRTHRKNGGGPPPFFPLPFPLPARPLGAASGDNDLLVELDVLVGRYTIASFHPIGVKPAPHLYTPRRHREIMVPLPRESFGVFPFNL